MGFREAFPRTAIELGKNEDEDEEEDEEETFNKKTALFLQCAASPVTLRKESGRIVRSGRLPSPP